uniref:Integrase catalytic domain-containing protein n=1 Tax=Daphnia galeata TaxID=27404 RepID=A0A8J2RHQ9_9CRUS|nr:unnamed protein product [Daphnia galeata]
MANSLRGLTANQSKEPSEFQRYFYNIAVSLLQASLPIAVLEQQCDELNEYVLNHGRRSIVNHLKGGLKRRMEELRIAHLEYNKALHINHEPLDDPYVYIIGHEMRVRGCFDLVKNYIHSRRHSPASSGKTGSAYWFYTACLRVLFSLQEKKPKGSPFLKKPASLFDKKPLVFHTTSPPPVHQNPSASPSSPSAPRKSNLKKCAYCGDAHSVKSCNTFKALDVTARAEWVKENRLLQVEGCTQRHHPLLHGAPQVFPVNPLAFSSTTPVNKPQAKNKPVAMATIDKESDDSTSLAIVSVVISANDVAEKLKCSEKKKKVSFGTLHGIDPEFDSMQISVTIKSLDRSFEAELSNYKDIKFATLEEPTILIGGGNQWLHLRMDERRPPNGINAPFGIRTPFGWTCVGELTSPSNTTTESPTEELLLRQVDKLWETDSFPIVTPVKPLESTEDQLARSKLDASIKFDGARYGFPWISDKELWLVGLDWYQPIPDTIMQQWNRRTATLNTLKDFKVPRALTLSNEIKNIQLHAFCDASTLGFGSFIYLRVTYATDVVTVNFVSSKSHVAPLRPLTVPKFELQGAIVALRLVKFIKSSLRITINQIFYWSDSKTVLQWIFSKTCLFQTFVANRLSEILEHSRPIEWRHNDRRLTGPAFLKPEEVTWPQPIKLTEPNEDDPEVSATKWVGFLYGPAPENRIRTLLHKYSDYELAMRVMAWMLRFISNSRLKSAKEHNESYLNVKAIQQASNRCIRSAQLECYPEEMTALEQNRLLKSSSPLLKLSPFIDKVGVLRAGGRLDYGPFPYDHDLLAHPSAERLLSSIRSLFWIIKGRVAIKRYLFKCLTCKRHRAMSCIPLMAPLPRHRLAPFQRPFNYVGLDFFCPCNITIYRRKEKRYGLLFTCLNTRSVHLEVTASLDLSSFLIAFASFAARRGRPLVVYSENGTQIVAGNKEIQQRIERLRKQNIVGQIIKQEIEWHFSPPSAPHFGGVWESLMKSAKVALEAIVEFRPLTEEILRGFVIQAESLLNGRPLTHVSVGPRDPEPLTPNHFLLLQALGGYVMSTLFWRRWLQEYIPTITDRRKWLFDKNNLAVDDVVLVVTPNSPRGHWPIGRVTRVVLSPDGVVHSVFVKTSAGEYHRPVAKLCLLETSTKD